MDVISFASFRIPTMWATSEERPKNLLDVFPALYERTSDVLQRVYNAYTLTNKKVLCMFKTFSQPSVWERVRTC